MIESKTVGRAVFSNTRNFFKKRAPSGNSILAILLPHDRFLFILYITSSESGRPWVHLMSKVAFGSKILKNQKLLWYIHFRHFGVNIEVAKILAAEYLADQNELEAKIKF